MIHLAFVEDDRQTATVLQDFIKRFAQLKNIDIEMRHFSDAQSLLSGYHPHFDLLLMDIRLGTGMNGMDAAKQIRKTDTEVSIIFITSLAQYAVCGYEVDALDFVVKPVTYEQFSMKMEKALRVISRKQGTVLSVPFDGGIKALPSRQLLYVEVSNHNLLFHTETGEYQTRGSLGKVEEQLLGHHFLRISVSQLVNLQYISLLHGSELTLSTGETLFVSRSRKKEVFSAFAEYLGGSI